MDIYKAIDRALRTSLARSDFRVVHVSIQGNHIHLIVEADSATALTRGMQGLKISMAFWINHALGRREGKVFAYRYHATSLESPRQVRNCIAYLLNNWRHHGEDRRSDALVDRYSSGVLFMGWKGVARFDVPAGYEPLPVAAPSTWLLQKGWQRHGLIGLHEVPGCTG